MEDRLGIHIYHVLLDPNGDYIKHVNCFAKLLSVDKVLVRSVPPEHPAYEKLEEIAGSFVGVENAYAIQAGREIRVIVNADKVDDSGSMKIARDIAKKVEDEMTYPGEVQVTLLREVRCVEYAK